MEIRKYRASDAQKTAALFYRTVYTVNAADYSAPQLDAWASGKTALVQWDHSLAANHAFVACEGRRVVGFGDIRVDGYLDRLYVDRAYLRRGIASALCDQLENAVEAKIITVHASITAKPFFESRGYHVIQEQQVVRGGVRLTNFVMKKQKNARAKLSIFS